MINMENVTKRYSNGHEALRGINFSMASGEMAFLTGYSGAGKSKLLKLIGLLERTNRGKIIVNNTDLVAIKDRNIPFFRRQIGIILQNPHLLPNATVFSNVALPLKIEGYTQGEINYAVREVIDNVGLSSKEKYLSEELSAGEQQRVAIARAAVNKPKLLIADEPTGNLDPDLSKDIIQLFETFHRTGTTILIASHAIELINTLPYRAYHIENGQFQTNTVEGANEESSGV